MNVYCHFEVVFPSHHHPLSLPCPRLTPWHCVQDEMTQQNNNAEQYATVRLQSRFSRGEQEEEEEEEASGREWQPLGEAPMDKKLTQWLIAAL
jgi:hypothetical protein